MILKKVKIEYYSDDLNFSKQTIVDILKEFGIFELELVEDFSINKLDYNKNFNFNKKVWSVIFCLPNNRFMNKIINEISIKLEQNLNECIFDIYVNELDTDSYKDEWKKSFLTTKITENIVINPIWNTYNGSDNEIVINIDPSMAFGTGTHGTTSLCIELIEKHIKKDDNMLDIGCGYGILMLVSKKLGAKTVTGIDIDKNCYNVVCDNFKKNNINSEYNILIGNLVDNIKEKYDLVVSNILVDVLEKLLSDIQKVLKNDSIVIFSGILKEKEEKFLEKASKIGLNLLDKSYKNEWVGLVFKYEVK